MGQLTLACKYRAFVAQMVERKTLNLVVEGSIPSEGVFFIRMTGASIPCCRVCSLPKKVARAWPDFSMTVLQERDPLTTHGAEFSLLRCRPEAVPRSSMTVLPRLAPRQGCQPRV